MSGRNWASIITLAALWGAVYLLIEVSLRELSPVLVVVGRVLFAALLLAPLAWHRQALQPLLKRPRAVLETVAVQSTIPLLAMTVGQQYVTSSLAGIIIGAQPVFVALLAYGFARSERPQGWKAVTGITLGMVGLMLIFGIDLRTGPELLLGGTLLVVAAACYAGGTIMIHRRLAGEQPLGVAAAAMTVTTVILLVPGLLTLPDHLPSAETLAALVVLGVVCTGATLALFYGLVVRAGPARAALAFYLSPGFAVAYGVLLLHEQITIATLLGLGAIVAGSALAAQRTKVT